MFQMKFNWNADKQDKARRPDTIIHEINNLIPERSVDTTTFVT